MFELPKQSNVKTYIPLFRIYSNCIWFSCNTCKESCTVRTIQLTYIDGISQTSPMCCVVAEPMHSGMISPVNVSSNPVNSNAPRSFKFWTLKGTDVKVRCNEMIIYSSCIVTDLYWQVTSTFCIYMCWNIQKHWTAWTTTVEANKWNIL